MTSQQRALLSLVNDDSRPARITLDGVSYGAKGPFSETLLALVPGENVPLPAQEVVIPDGSLPILGSVRMPRGEARGIVRDGKIVSWAVARPLQNGVRELTVETAPAYRGQGLAKACLQALVHALPDPLLYLCDSRNTHSFRAAQGAGFVLLGTIER